MPEATGFIPEHVENGLSDSEGVRLRAAARQARERSFVSNNYLWIRKRSSAFYLSLEFIY